MDERSIVVSIEAWGPGSGAYDDDALAELAPALWALGAKGSAVGAGGIAGGPNASMTVSSPPAEPLAEVVARAVGWFERGCADLGLEHGGIARVDVQEERYETLGLDEVPERYAGVSEVAKMLGLSRQRVSELRARDDFPDPVAELAAGPVWKVSHPQRFVREWPRKPGRPRKRATA